jgi:hypothetical protein
MSGQDTQPLRKRIRAYAVRFAPLLACLAIFLAVFGAKLVIIQRYTMPHPYWDAWHVEGLELYKPFLTGSYRFSDLFTPVSEHRPVILRLYALALLALNGQWDVQLQMVGNAALLGLFACLLYLLLRRGLEPVYSALLAAAIGLVVAVPTGWENNVNGHHAGWFFFYIFTLLTLRFCVACPPLGVRWWLGWVSAALAYLSLFAGVITPVAAAAGMLFRMVRERRFDRRTVAGIVLLMLLFAAGMYWQHRFPGQANVKARDFLSFLTAFGYTLVWPSAQITMPAFFVHAPFLIAVYLILSKRWNLTPAAGLLISLVIWVVLQGAGMAYARGMDGIPPVTRYLDILSFGVLANFTLLLMLLQSCPAPKRFVVPASVFAVVWLALVGYDFHQRVNDAFAAGLPQKANDSFTQDALLRAYVATGQRGYIDGKATNAIAYYGGPDALAAVLTDTAVRAILPYTIREPLRAAEWQGNTVFRAGALPADAPTLRDKIIIGSFASSGATGTWTSSPIDPPHTPYLDIRVAGDLGRRGVSLRLVTENGAVTELAPSEAPGNRWTSVQAEAPQERFRIVASDSDAKAWLAFSPPRAMARLSKWAASLVGAASTIVISGVVCFVLLFALVAAQMSRVTTVAEHRATETASIG